MKTFGTFTDQDTFVIDDPRSPEPWLHYLIRPEQKGTETYAVGITATAGGFDVKGTHENTFVDTRLHMNDDDSLGRHMYIKDAETGEYWSNCWQPCRREGQSFESSLEFGRVSITTEYKGIHCQTRFFIPMEFDGLVQRIVVRNGGDTNRSLELFPYIPLHMGDALDRLVAGDNDAMFGGVSYDKELGVLVARRNHGTAAGDPASEIGGMLGNVGVFYSSLHNHGEPFETDQERFYGSRFRGPANPGAIEASSLSSSEVPYLRNACGAYMHRIKLAPGEEVELVVAFVSNSTHDYFIQKKKQLRHCLSLLESPQRCTEMEDRVLRWWSKHLAKVSISTPNPKLNRAFKWLQYQCQVVYVLNRMKSRFHTGYEYGWGFRDILQDVLFYMTYDTETVKQTLLHVGTQMFSDGQCYHNFFIEQKGSLIPEASDDPLWYVNAVIRFVQETGDFDFLDQTIAYADEKEGRPSAKGTVLDHCIVGLERVWTDRSERNLPLMKDCDWNDDLNELRVDGGWNDRVESVMVAQQLYQQLLSLARLLEVSGRRIQLVPEYRHRASIVAEALEHHCLDSKGYYKRALDMSGRGDLGTSADEEGSMYLEPQAFAVLTGVATGERAKRVLRAVEEQLDSPYGAMLLFPYYRALSDRAQLPERSWNIEKEPPGMKENGGIFMHLNAWLVQAYAMAAMGKKAVDHYLKTIPENLASDQERYRVEPYVYPEYVRGSGAYMEGRGGHTWLTGTAPTTHQALVEYICGLRADYDGLVVDPALDPQWQTLKVERTFRGCRYYITIDNTAAVEKGVASLTMDGQIIEGTLLPPGPLGGSASVTVVMG